MRFVIMQGTVGYRPDEAAAEEPIAGQEGTVLRLLLLHRKNSLTTEEIARHLTRSGAHTVRPSSVPGYIARLRSKAGPWCVTSKRGGYSSDIDQSDVDAFVFKRLIEEYGVTDISDVDSMDDSWAEKYEQLLDLHAMWRANPALPFDDEDDDFLAATYHEFERYWDYLQRCIIYCELRSRRKPRIEKAADRLDQLLRQDPDDEQSWALLVRARASLPGSETAVSALLARIRMQFPGGRLSCNTRLIG